MSQKIGLFPLVVAVVIWGQHFKNRRILENTDNKGVLYVVICLSSKSPLVVKLLRH